MKRQCETLSFIGTRAGMTPAQQRRFRAAIEYYQPTTFNHTCQIGAEEQAQEIVNQLLPTCRCNGYPSTDKRFTVIPHGCQALPPKRLLDCYRAISFWCDVLIVAPGKQTIPERSQAMHAMEEARNHGAEVFVLWPDGTRIKLPETVFSWAALEEYSKSLTAHLRLLIDLQMNFYQHRRPKDYAVYLAEKPRLIYYFSPIAAGIAWHHLLPFEAYHCEPPDHKLLYRVVPFGESGLVYSPPLESLGRFRKILTSS